MGKRNINIQEKKCKCISKAQGCTERWATFKIFNPNKSDQNHWRRQGPDFGCRFRTPKSEAYGKAHELTHLCIVAGWNQEVSEHQELVICELLLVLLPVVVVGPPEIGERFLHSHLPAQWDGAVSQGAPHQNQHWVQQTPLLSTTKGCSTPTHPQRPQGIQPRILIFTALVGLWTRVMTSMIAPIILIRDSYKIQAKCFSLTGCFWSEKHQRNSSSHSSG